MGNSYDKTRFHPLARANGAVEVDPTSKGRGYGCAEDKSTSVPRFARLRTQGGSRVRREKRDKFMSLKSNN